MKYLSTFEASKALRELRYVNTGVSTTSACLLPAVQNGEPEQTYALYSCAAMLIRIPPHEDRVQGAEACSTDDIFAGITAGQRDLDEDGSRGDFP